MKVLWFSTGVSSFISAYLERESIDKFIYCHIEDQHPDSLRFLKDCENVLGKEIEVLQSRYENVENVCRTFNMINMRGVAKCTEVLKMRIRKEWEYEHSQEDLTYVWGYDKYEKMRAYKMNESMPQFKHSYPLLTNNFSKEDCHGLLKKLNIKRPLMYDMGYTNNNCIGCLKGGMGYWNKIRKDFPDVFEKRAKMERDIGFSCLSETKIINGKNKKVPLFLDELSSTRGNMNTEVMEECGIACQLNFDNWRI